MGILALITIFAVIGIGTIVSGIRGRSVVCEPVCANCGYDLCGYAVFTRCSECGSDLNSVGAVRRNQFRSSRKKILAGLLLISLPWFLIAFLMLWDWAGPDWERIRSNQSLVSEIDRLQQFRRHFLWEELTRRLQSGRLSKPEASAAINQLIITIQRQDSGSPLDWVHSFYWATDFFAAADRAGAITSSQYLAIAQLCYGKTPALEFPNGLSNQYPSQFYIRPAHHYGELPGMHEAFTILEISMSEDGSQAKAINLLGTTGDFTLAPKAPPGKYQVKCVIRMDLLRGSSSFSWPSVSPIPPNPPPLAQWTETITAPMNVEP